MATYIVLVNFTDQGVRTIKDIPERLRRVDEIYLKVGGAMTGWYLTMGAYDAVITAEAPDDEAMARATLAFASAGNVRTTTLRAFARPEAEKLLQSLP